MRKHKIKINGIKYKYIITEENTIRVDGIVPHTIYETIKERLTKQGKYQENKVETIEVHYNEKYLQRRFMKWSTVELKMYLQELLDKKDNLTSQEALCMQPIKEELDRRRLNQKVENKIIKYLNGEI